MVACIDKCLILKLTSYLGMNTDKSKVVFMCRSNLNLINLLFLFLLLLIETNCKSNGSWIDYSVQYSVLLFTDMIRLIIVLIEEKSTCRPILLTIHTIHLPSQLRLRISLPCRRRCFCSACGGHPALDGTPQR